MLPIKIRVISKKDANWIFPVFQVALCSVLTVSLLICWFLLLFFSHRYVRDLLLNPPAYEIALTIQGGSLAYMWPYLQLYMTILIFAIQQFTY